jgi:hypothetical protein
MESSLSSIIGGPDPQRHLAAIRKILPQLKSLPSPRRKKSSRRRAKR